MILVLSMMCGGIWKVFGRCLEGSGRCVLIFWGCLEGVSDVSWECLEGVLRVSEGCHDSVRRMYWQFQKGVLTMSEGCLDAVSWVSWVSLHVFLLQIFGHLMSGRNVLGPKNLLIPNNLELIISLNPNLLWIIFFDQILFVLSFYFPSFSLQYCCTWAPSCFSANWA